jgi:hypothetical protein
VSTQTGSKTPRRWLIALPTVILILLGALWSGFWFWSSSKALTRFTAWQSHEAELGRVIGCAKPAFGGYPFRIEIACPEPAVADRKSGLAIRAHNLAAVAQVWDPTLMIGELGGPLTIAPLDGSPMATIDWTLAQASLRGLPGAPERLSVVLENPSLNSVPSSGALARAGHMEVHARLSGKSTAGHPALDLALELKSFSAPGLVPVLGTFGPLASASTDVSAEAVVNGTSDLASKPLGSWLREIRAAGGGVEITNARIAQGDMIAVGSGNLTLTARGTLAGELRWTVANFAKLVPMLGIDQAVAKVVSPDTLNRVAPALNRLMPGLGNFVRGGNTGTGNAPAGGSAEANASAVTLAARAGGGPRTHQAGQSAVIVTLRFDDGVAYLGPLKLGQIPPLF